MSTNSPPPIDLRIRRTRKLLSGALVALLGEQSFESITVRQICERAMVHRATFYTHFADKYELLRAVLSDIQADLRDIQTSEEWGAESSQLLLQFVDYVVAHRSLFTLLLVEKDAHSLTALMRRQFAAMTEAQVKNLQASGVHYSVPASVMAQFFAGAVLGVVSWWLENDQPISAEQLTEYLDHLLSKQYEGPDSGVAPSRQ